MAHGNRKEYPINNRNVLNRMYWDEGLSQREIANKIGCSIPTVQRRMKEFGIKGREWTTKGKKFPNQNTPKRLKKMAEGRIKSKKWKESLIGRNRPDMEKSSHWNWKGGITSFDRLERARFQKTIQKRVFERDDYTCQICNKRGGKLQVDHIQSWAEYVELRFDINNCRTICMACHYEITFGKPMPPTVRAWGHNLLKGENKL